MTDALNRQTETVYDDLDLPSQVTDALDLVVKFESNGNRDLKKLTDPRNNVYMLAWESSGRRKSLTWPDSEAEQSVYDADENLSQWNARGGDASVTLTRNAAQEVSATNWANGTESGSTSITRNSAGQVSATSTTSQNLTVGQSLGYSAGRLSSLSQTVGSATRNAAVTFDLNGDIASITYPAGFTITYERNSDRQVTAIKMGSVTLASYTYDSAGRLSTRTLSNGVVTTYTYDGADRLASITVSKDGTVLWAERYGYNAAGERIYTLKGTTGTVGDAYSLDATSQLVGVKYGATSADQGYASATSPASSAAWAFDPAGNRTSQTKGSATTNYTANDVNQYTAVGSETPTYSSRGDLASIGNWTLANDAQGNLIRAHNSQSNVLAKYWRDAFGHRAVKEVDGAKTLFFNLGNTQLEAYNVQAPTASSTIYEPGIDRPLAEVGSSGAITFYHQDWLGNVVLLSDSSGATVEKYAYDAWGSAAATDNSNQPIPTSSIASRFLYTAREFDKETDLYHYRARAYSSELGRFLQNDLIDFEGAGYNLLWYVSNNPTGNIDPTGEFAIPLVYYGLAAAGAAAAGTSAWLNTPEGREAMESLGHSISDGLENLLEELSNLAEGKPIDGGEDPCPEEELTPDGPPVERPSKSFPGGKSVEHPLKDKAGRPVTRHELYDRGGKLRDKHWRPGPPKGL